MSDVNVVQASIFEVQAQTIVNTVNCVGVMGKGIALGFKERFPEMYRDYVARCNRGDVRLGEPYLFTSLLDQWILNFPTKKHWRSLSRLEDIKRGLEFLETHYREWGIESLAVPPLGCGNGGLEWRAVGPVLYQHLARLDIPVTLIAPQGTPAEQMLHEFFVAGSTVPSRHAISQLRPAWLALAAIAARVNRDMHRTPVGRVMFQKLGYFATESGIPTEAVFRRGSYGPFAPDLQEAISTLINSEVLREERVSQGFMYVPGKAYRTLMDEHLDELRTWAGPVEKVMDLFMRVSSTRNAELVATVHFAARELSDMHSVRPSEQDVVAAVLDWKRRRKEPFHDAEVLEAVRSLQALGWLDLSSSPSDTEWDEELQYA